MADLKPCRHFWRERHQFGHPKTAVAVRFGCEPCRKQWAHILFGQRFPGVRRGDA